MMDLGPIASSSPNGSPFLPFGVPAIGRTWRVGPGITDDHRTLSAALAKVSAGDRVEVSPGTYRESLLELLVPIEIYARDGLGSVLVEAIDHDGFHVVSNGRMRGFVVRRLGGLQPDSDTVAAVAVVAGHFFIEDCLLLAPAPEGHGLLAVTPLARPVLERTEVDDCGGIGVVALGGARVELRAGSQVHGCAADGLMAGGIGSSLRLTDSEIRSNGATGAILDDGAQGVMDNCLFDANRLAGVWAGGAGSVLRMTGCTSRGQDVGAMIGRGAQAFLKSTDIIGNRQRAVIVDGQGSRAIIDDSTLDGGEIGLVAQNGGVAWLNGKSVVRGSVMAGLSALGAGSRIEADHCDISAIKQFGMLVSEGASGVLASSEVRECGYALVVNTSRGGRMRVLGNDIYGNGQGVMIHGGTAELMSNRIRLNAGFGLFLGAAVRPDMADNEIHDNGVDIKREDGHWLARATGLVVARLRRPA